MQIFQTHSEAETEQVGADFAASLPGGTVVAFYGELGSGKTAFVRGMARGMGLIVFILPNKARGNLPQFVNTMATNPGCASV